MNNIDTYHESMVSLQHRRFERRKRVAETPWPEDRKARALAEIDVSVDLECLLLGAYFGVWE